ncbi:MAG: 5-formyltetrahydrofolate cyclo-ligase [Actinobacteria bacterium]|nr:MAG: 5-formyltetrahydrofolate cyclo-ligase [Actinomycetota bacterium]
MPRRGDVLQPARWPTATNFGLLYSTGGRVFPRSTAIVRVRRSPGASSTCPWSARPLASRPIEPCGANSRRRLYLPVTVPPRRMTFARWRRGDQLRTSSFGIDEPLPAARRVATHRLDVVLVPLVAFDRRGIRLGYGAGYYDAAFAFRLRSRRTRPLLVGLAHAFQEVPHIDARAWDVPLDLVVTEHSVVDCTVSSTR